jgi:N-acetylglucosaminyl-diphospho-decaprenol L-rhamnosyltransferase
MSFPTILVAIVNYRTPELVVGCLQSLEPEIRANPGARVIVVDNASGDRSVEIIGGAIKASGYEGWCSLVAAPRNGGFSYGNNLAIRTWRERTAPAGGELGPFPDYVWLLNPDTLVLPGALTELVAFMESRPEVGIAGSRSTSPEGEIHASGFRFHGLWSEIDQALRLGSLKRRGKLAAVGSFLERHRVGLPASDEPARVDWVSGSTFFVRREVFERIGMFDEGYFLYWEETDFCLRAARAGFSCWHLPASVIMHIGGESTGVRRGPPQRLPHYWFESRARFLRHRYGSLRAHLLNLAWLGVHPIGWLLARLWGLKDRWPPLLWWDFLRHTYGPRSRRGASGD